MIAPIIKTRHIGWQRWRSCVAGLPRHWTRQCYHGETSPSQVFFLLSLSCRSGYSTSLTLFFSSSSEEMYIWSFLKARGDFYWILCICQSIRPSVRTPVVTFTSPIAPWSTCSLSKDIVCPWCFSLDADDEKAFVGRERPALSGRCATKCDGHETGTRM